MAHLLPALLSPPTADFDKVLEQGADDGLGGVGHQDAPLQKQAQAALVVCTLREEVSMMASWTLKARGRPCRTSPPCSVGTWRLRHELAAYDPSAGELNRMRRTGMGARPGLVKSLQQVHGRQGRSVQQQNLPASWSLRSPGI